MSERASRARTMGVTLGVLLLGAAGAALGGPLRPIKTRAVHHAPCQLGPKEKGPDYATEPLYKWAEARLGAPAACDVQAIQEPEGGATGYTFYFGKGCADAACSRFTLAAYGALSVRLAVNAPQAPSLEEARALLQQEAKAHGFTLDLGPAPKEKAGSWTYPGSNQPGAAADDSGVTDCRAGLTARPDGAVELWFQPSSMCRGCVG